MKINKGREIKNNETYLKYGDYYKLLYDEFGNRKNAHEIARYYKRSDGIWHEQERYSTLGGSTYVIDDKIYFKCNDSLIPMNMDFDSKTCGACEQIIKEIPITHKITGNEILLKFKHYTEEYSLCKQCYSDVEPFYTLKDSRGQFRVNHGNHNINELICTLCNFFSKNEEITTQLKAFTVQTIK